MLNYPFKPLDSDIECISENNNHDTIFCKMAQISKKLKKNVIIATFLKDISALTNTIRVVFFLLFFF